MGVYIDSLLTGDEKVLFETKLSLVEYIKYGFVILCGGVVTILGISGEGLSIFYGIIGFLVFAVVVGAYPWLMRHCSEFAVTSRRVIMKTGIISRNVFEMRLQKIESVDLIQSVFGRFLNYGTVIVHGTGDTARRFDMIADPVTFRRVIDRACEAIRSGQ